jgi:hypothetical protein
VYLSGHPIWWSERHQEIIGSLENNGTLLEWRELGREPEKFIGWNPVLPTAVVLAAVSLPPVVATLAARLVRRVRRRAAAVPFSRPARLWCVLLFASVAAVAVAWLEVETAEFGVMTPMPAHQPSRWAVELHATYRKVVEHARQGRWWLDARLPGGFLSSEWPSRTRLTVAAFLSGAGVGCVLFRPWRRASAESQPT